MKNPPAGDWQLHPQLAADSHPLTTFALCELRLMDDNNYPWLVLVPRVPEAQELIDLRSAERHLLSDEVDRAARALRAVFRPRKLNVAALGNVVSQLHVHVIARFEEDPAWPAPVWGRVAAQPYTPEQLVDRITRLQDALRG
jgi:diadenosine tetraphosphate (Ap4A) HIT family hydrolase